MTAFLLMIILVVTMACATSKTAAPAQITDPATICVVRHAQAHKNLEPPPAQMTSAQLDALTSKGEAQARAMQEGLPAHAAVIWTSPLGRTRQTADILAQGASVVVHRDLRPLDGEMDYDARVAAASRGDDPRPADGESLHDGAERVRAVLTQLRQELDTGEDAVVVTHGDIASLLLGELRGIPLLDRPEEAILDTGQMMCLPLDRPAIEESMAS